MWKRWWGYLCPREEALDPGFAEEMQRLSVVGLRALAAVNLAGTTLVLLFVSIAFPQFQLPRHVAISFLTMALGGAALGASYWRRAFPHARAIGLGLAFLVATVSLAAMMRPGYELSVDMVHAHMPIIVSLFLLVQTVAFPLKPVVTFAYGTAMLGSYLGLTAALRTTEELTGMIALHVFLELLVVLLASGLTGVLYQQRLLSYRSRRLAEESFEQLKSAQARLLLSRSAAAQSRLAAAMTHELATPLGAFASALDTVRLAVEKLGPSDAGGDRLGAVAREALRAASESHHRLQKTMARMKGVTNLDGAEERPTDLNELWRDTVELLSSEIRSRAEVRFYLQPVPRTRCRPEQISAVLSNLLRNAVAAMESPGRIEIRTTSRRGQVVSELRDTGRGMTAAVVERLFEPAFRVDEGRVTTSNWGLFVSRSIVLDHGGDIEVESEPGRGTTVRVVLPAR
jgi:signal transduction histidine kinase